MLRIGIISFFVAQCLAKSHGWNDNIKWANDIDDMYKQIKETGKPGMKID